MNFDWLLINNRLFVNLTLSVPGYVILLALAALLVLALLRAASSFARLSPRQWMLYAATLITGPLLAQVMIVGTGPAARPMMALGLLAYLPALVAALWLGGGPAITVGLLTGASVALLGTGRLAEPLVMALVGAFWAFVLSRRYRGRTAALLRQPAVAALLGAIVVAWPLTVLGIYATGQAVPLANLERAIAAIGPALWIHGLAALVAGVMTQGIIWGWPHWHPVSDEELEPAPWEQHLSQRILITFIPGALLSILLLVGMVAGTSYRVATTVISEQMARDAETVSSKFPFFNQIGRSLIRDIAADAPDDLAGDAARQHLISSNQTLSYFQQLILLDGDLSVQSTAPAASAVTLSAAERESIIFALDGGTPEEVTVVGATGEPVIVSFITAVPVVQGDEPIGALVGRTSLGANPALAPIVDVLREGIGGAGEGLIIDEQARILLYPAHPERQQGTFSLTDLQPVANRFTGTTFRQREDDGTRRLVYQLPVSGRPGWSIIVLVPNEVVLALAVQIALPTLVLLLVLLGLSFPLLISVIRQITTPLERLAAAADHIAVGELDRPLNVSGEDEIGSLGRAFEQMRLRLKRRLDEQERLLNVSRSVSANLELFRAMPPILSGALEVTGAVGVRVALRRADDADLASLQSYAAGEAAAAMAVLDRQLFELAERQGTIVISRLARAAGSLDTSNLLPRIQALVTLPLRSDTSFHGIMWLGYDHEHIFEQAEMTFLSTIAGQAAVAVANARLFTQAEEGRRKLEAVLESTADGMIVVGNDGRVVLLNPAAEEYFGVRMEQAVGRKASEVIGTPELAELMTDLQEPVSVLELPHQNGRTLLANTSTIVSQEGGISGRVAVLRDITALKELDNIKTVFLRMVSHDLRSPLTYMRGYVSMLPLNGTLNQRQQADLERIHNGIEHISQMTERLTYLSRLQFGEEAELEYTLIDIEDLLEEVASRHIQLADDKDITIELALEEGLPLVMADGMLYGQALNNLVHNALKYTPEGGSVSIQAYQPDDETVAVAVTDTGMGIRKEDQARLFEAFYRVPQHDNDPPRPKGSGLGLALVRAIAQAHGGHVSIQSEWGEGSTFTIVIPVGDPAAF